MWLGVSLSRHVSKLQVSHKQDSGNAEGGTNGFEVRPGPDLGGIGAGPQASYQKGASH